MLTGFHNLALLTLSECSRALSDSKEIRNMVPCTLSWFNFWASQIFKHCVRWYVINESKSVRTTLIFSNLFIAPREICGPEQPNHSLLHFQHLLCSPQELESTWDMGMCLVLCYLWYRKCLLLLFLCPVCLWHRTVSEVENVHITNPFS